MAKKRFSRLLQSLTSALTMLAFAGTLHAAGPSQSDNPSPYGSAGSSQSTTQTVQAQVERESFSDAAPTPCPRPLIGDEMVKGAKWDAYWKCILQKAERGDPESQYEVGIDYVGMQNYTEALRWFHLSAEQDYHSAQVWLGGLYQIGRPREIAKDFYQAAQWYRLSAEQGNFFGAKSLAEMYEAGEGVERNYSEAFFWYAIALGASPESNPMGKHLTEQKIQIVQREACRWKPRKELAFYQNSGLIPPSSRPPCPGSEPSIPIGQK